MIEDTLDWVAGLCGLTVPPRPPRRLRAAVRALGSDHMPVRLQAETELCANRSHAAPLLRQAARAQEPFTRAVRAALLLHRFQEKEGPEMLRRMVRDHAVCTGPQRDLLRHAVRDVVGHEHYVRQAAAAVTHLEQRPESFKAIVRFRQAAQILRFLDIALPVDLLRRAMVVRTVGGENLSEVRLVLQEDPDFSLEHVCMVRREAAMSVAALRDRSRALHLLSQNLAHPNPAVQLTAMYGLEQIGDPRAISGLLPLAQDADCPVREDARRLIERLKFGRPDALTLLRAAPIDAAPPETLLRPAEQRPDENADSLLRPHKSGSR
jgi:HEAT repeat protein